MLFRSAMAAGSEIICRNNTGDDIDAEKLEAHSFGCRTEEGFGRVRVDWHNKMEIENVGKEAVEYTLPDNASAARNLVQHVLDKELEAAVINYAVGQFNQFKQFKGKTLSNSFIGRLKLLIAHSMDIDALNKNIKFSKRAFDQLAKLEKFWPLSKKKDENDKDIFIANLGAFTKKILEIQKPGEIGQLKQIMSILDIKEDYIKDDETKQLKLFKLFANHFLTLARLCNREEV